MPLRRLTALTVPFILALPTALTAQSAQRWSVQASGLYAGLFGQAYDEVKDGFGGEVQLRFTPSRLSIGMGGQLTIHKLTGGDFNDNVKLWGLFLEPRLRIRTSSPTVAPYVSARVAYLRFSISTDDIAGSANGVQLNGGGGFL